MYSVFLFLFSGFMFMAGCFMSYVGYSLFLEWEIVVSMGSSCVMSLIFDWMSMIFLSSVFIIASGISMFSDYYMKGDSNYVRFMILLGLFVLSMVFFIVSPNVMSILLGWDGLGLTSYVLVIYYQNDSSCSAGMLTVLSNRIGDVCILMVISLMFFMGSWNYFLMDKSLGVLISGFVIVAGMTKSAQIPFSAWLPAAMAAPTPVSALVHSSTLVTAGIYLLIRFFNLIEGSVLLNVLYLLAIMTMFMSGLGANFEMDMKKIIALSTLSQLGLMMMILSQGMPELAFFHLVAHAMFKSTLFMCGGAMIHMAKGSQDSRFMSNLSSASPVLMGMFGLTNLSLLGFPFLSGFCSKDLVLEWSFNNSFNLFFIVLIVVSTGLTVCYSVRVMFLGMSMMSNLSSVSELGDSEDSLLVSMIILFFLSILGGYMFSWLFFLNGTSLVLNIWSKYYILMVMLVSYFLVLGLNKSLKISVKFNKMMGLWGLSKMWFMPFLSGKNQNFLFLKSSSNLFGILDKGWLELYGGEGGKIMMLKSSGYIQMGQLSVMLMSYFLSVVLLGLAVLFYCGM